MWSCDFIFKTNVSNYSPDGQKLFLYIFCERDDVLFLILIIVTLILLYYLNLLTRWINEIAILAKKMKTIIY